MSIEIEHSMVLFYCISLLRKRRTKSVKNVLRYTRNLSTDAVNLWNLGSTRRCEKNQVIEVNDKPGDMTFFIYDYHCRGNKDICNSQSQGNKMIAALHPSRDIKEALQELVETDKLI